MKIIVISSHKGITGSPINLLDFQDYLIRKSHDVVFYYSDEYHLMNTIAKSSRKYETGEFKQIEDFILHRKENVVTDFKTLISLDVPIICKNLIVFDNAEISYHLNGITNFFYKKDVGDIREVLKKHHFSKVIFLMPKCNHDKFKVKYPDLQSTIFYKKINIKALLTIHFSNNNKWFYRADDTGYIPKEILKYNKSWAVNELSGVDLQKMFEYSGYVYYRRADRNKFEQLGRTIFEFLIMGKKVHYVHHPNEINDGLKDYWNHYGKGDKEIIRIMMLEDYDYRPWEN